MPSTYVPILFKLFLVMYVVVLYSHEFLLSSLTLFVKSNLKFENQFQVKNLMFRWRHLVPLNKKNITEVTQK